jgi:chorismate--pyruvate lyase
VHGAGNRHFRSWLTEPGSLTARCQAACRNFRIRLLFCGRRRPLPDENVFFGLRRQQYAWSREVLLECDGVPVIFAHTAMPLQPAGRLTRWLAGLGSRSLGSLLFANPGFTRGGIEFIRIDARHPLFKRAVAATGLSGAAELWGRRSAHSLAGQTVLVTEVFLPDILRLER